MKTPTVLTLHVGDQVRDSTNTLGMVVGFIRDRVAINWGGPGETGRYTDTDLKSYGIVRVSPFDPEDTEPGWAP